MLNLIGTRFLQIYFYFYELNAWNKLLINYTRVELYQL